MPRYIKIYLDDRRRKNYSEKKSRSFRFHQIFDKNRMIIGQPRLFKTYCQISGASHSVYSQFALSRNSLRKYANFGLVSGVKPSSW